MARTVLCESSSYDFAPQTDNSNVIPFRQKILARHKNYLSQWLDAGLSMGLLDASVDPLSPFREQITIWVRESAKPAYIVTPIGKDWVLTDHLNDCELGRFSSLDRALNKVRPVLPLIH